MNETETTTGAADVIYRLARHIAARESERNTGTYEKPDPRTYYLELVRQCSQALNGTTEKE